VPQSRKLILAAVVLLIAGGAAFYYWHREREIYRLDALLARLPVTDAAIVHIDFSALRSAGAMKWLSGTGAEEEPDYKAFVSKTGFDYKRDLDLALGAFHPSGTFFLVRGRFDWQRLETYAQENHGTCYRSLCRMPGSKPERRISFFPLRKDLMALAVSTDDFAASRLDSGAQQTAPISFPSNPVWIHLTRGALRDPERFPEGTRLIAKALEIADSTNLSLGPGSKEGFEARLEAQCPNEKSAQALVETLDRITTLLSTLLRREAQSPGPGDLAGVLTSGKFKRDGLRALGTWQLSQAFVAKLAESVEKPAEAGK
jgi:hypothetical protein